MQRYVLPTVICFALALGVVHAQSPASFGVSLSVGAFGLPLPLIGVHASFADAIAGGVGLRLNLSAALLGAGGAWLVGGIAGADAVWTFAAADDDTLRPYAGGGPGFVFAGGSSGTDGGIGFAPQLSVVGGVHLPVGSRDAFVEGRGHVAFGVLDGTLVWLSLAAGLFF